MRRSPHWGSRRERGGTRVLSGFAVAAASGGAGEGAAGGAAAAAPAVATGAPGECVGAMYVPFLAVQSLCEVCRLGRLG